MSPEENAAATTSATPEWLTVHQAATRIRVSDDYVRRLVRDGFLEAAKLPGGRNGPLRISAESLDALLESCQVGPLAKPAPRPTRRGARRRRSAAAAAWGV